MAKATAMAKQAGRAKATDSTIAALPTHTTTAAVRAARPAGLATGNNYTGQYLYDRFITDGDKEDSTKMDIVKAMADALDVKKFGDVIADFVGVAKGFYDNAVAAAKAAGPFDPKNAPIAVRTAGAKLKTARNHQTVMRTAYGALKFAADEWAKATDGAPIGYRMVREIGADVLARKGINWDGTKAESKATRQQRQDLREENEALLEVQGAHPRNTGESRADYMARVDKLVDKRIKERADERRVKVIETLTKKIRDMAGDNLPEILDALLSDEPEQIQAPAADAALH
jgi:hypothetical protein